MNITRGIIKSAKKVVIYGPEGIGKSTFAAQFPETVFIDTEGSTKNLDVSRFDKPSSWAMLLDQLDYVIKNKPCKTLVIDTVDWAEAMCLESVCAAHGKKGIEDFGYGNGYVYEKEEFGKFLNKLNDVIAVSVNVVLTAHAIIRKFELPDEMGAYDRWELKLGKKTTNLISPLVKEWADMVLFANYKTLSVAADKDGKKHKAQGGKRVMYTAHHPCWDAKNRFGLPDEIPFEYSQIAAIIDQHDMAPPVHKSENIPEETPPIHSTPAPTPDVKPTANTKGIPKALSDLMEANNVTETMIQMAVAKRGHFPIDMPVADYPDDYVNGVLIGAWDQVLAVIKELMNDDYPF